MNLPFRNQSAPAVPTSVVLIAITILPLALFIGCAGGDAEVTTEKEQPKHSRAGSKENPNAAPEKNDTAYDSRLSDEFPDLPKANDPGSPVQLRFKPVAGATWNYVVNNDMQMNSMGLRSRESNQATLSYTIESVAGETFQVVGGVPRIESRLETPNGGYTIDTDKEKQQTTPGFESMPNIWNAVVAGKATYSVDSLGQVSDLKKPDVIEQAIKSSDNAEMFGMTTDMFVNNYIAGFITLPEKDVRPGDEWECSKVIDPFNSDKRSEIARFLGTTEESGRQLAMIELVTSHSTAEGTGIVESMESNTVALIFFDVEGGYIEKMYAVGTFSMNLNINGRTIPQESTLVNTFVKSS